MEQIKSVKPVRDDSQSLAEGPVSSRPACPVCGGRLIEQRGKLICSRCRTVCETCCEGSRG